MPSSLNGTGVTFNDGTTLQSGNIPAANLGSGTANSNTFLRGDRTFATPPSQAPTTAQVLSATAGASAGAVGTYALLHTDTGGGLGVGGTRAASSLFFTSVFPRSGTRPTGTWRLMGHIAGSNANTTDQNAKSLFLRIS